MDLGGCHQQAIYYRHGSYAIETAPLIRHGCINRQGAVAKGGRNIAQPLVERARLGRIS